MRLHPKSSQETAQLILSRDWENHPLGPIENWDSVLINFLNLIFNTDQSHFIFWSKDAYCFYNDSFISVMGQNKHPHLLGKKYNREFGGYEFDTINSFFQRAMHGESVSNSDQAMIVERNGKVEEAYFTYNFAPIISETGEVLGVFVTTIDTTERVLKSNNVLMKQDQFKAALEVTKLGYYDWDIIHNKIFYNKRFQEDWGISENVSLEEALEYIHPDDRARVSVEINKAVDNHTPYETTYRIIHPTKGLTWIEAKGEVTYKDGKAIRFFGTSLNVTVQYEARLDLEKAQQDLYQFFMQAPNPMTIILGEELRYFMANPPYIKMVGRDVVGKTPEEAFGTTIIEPFIGILRNAFRNGISYEGKELELKLKDEHGVEKTRLLNVIYHPFKEMNGKVKGVLCFHQDVTDQVKVRKRIEQYAVELKESLQTRDEFISIASHELKTPITSLKLQLEMVKRRLIRSDDKSLEGVKVTEGLEHSLKQVERLTELVENLLDVSRIQIGKLTFKFQEMDVRELLVEVLDRLSDTAEVAKTPIVLQMNEEITVNWDRSRIDQVMINLLTNAIKYAPGMPVKVIVQSNKNDVQITVSDSGIGIEQDRLATIFDKFKRVHASRNISGLGLGLYIVQQIVLGHHGTITVESELGVGTKFIMKLPRRS